jgi:hypothetical protein
VQTESESIWQHDSRNSIRNNIATVEEGHWGTIEDSGTVAMHIMARGHGDSCRFIMVPRPRTILKSQGPLGGPVAMVADRGQQGLPDPHLL